MTITIDLAPEALAQLREKAEREGQKPESVAAVVLTEALEWEMRDRAAAIEGIRRGLEAGRVISLEAWDAKMRAKHNIPENTTPLTDAEADALP